MMKSRPFTLAASIASLLLLCAGSASSQPTVSRTDLQACAKIEDDLARLACFDALNLRLRGAPSVTAPVKGVGLWRVTTERSKIDDSTSVTAMLTAQEPISIRYRQARPIATARCREGDLDFYIDWGVFIGSSSQTVTARLDSEEAESLSWSVSTDHTATFYPGKKMEFFEQLANAKKLVVRTTPYSESSVITSFNIAGFKNVLPALLKACDK